MSLNETTTINSHRSSDSMTADEPDFRQFLDRKVRVNIAGVRAAIYGEVRGVSQKFIELELQGHRPMFVSVKRLASIEEMTE